MEQVISSIADLIGAEQCERHGRRPSAAPSQSTDAVSGGAYPRGVSELPIEQADGHLAEVAEDAVERGKVVYLTDAQGRRLAAIVPPDIAAAGAAAVEALEEAVDIAAAEAALDEPGESILGDDLWRELGLA
jgi:hypothetical protein